MAHNSQLHMEIDLAILQHLAIAPGFLVEMFYHRITNSISNIINKSLKYRRFPEDLRFHMVPRYLKLASTFNPK